MAYENNTLVFSMKLKTVSFLCMNEFGGLEHQDRFFVFALFRFCKHRMLHVHERRAGTRI
jgi:hypothetical protein